MNILVIAKMPDGRTVWMRGDWTEMELRRNYEPLRHHGYAFPYYVSGGREMTIRFQMADEGWQEGPPPDLTEPLALPAETGQEIPAPDSAVIGRLGDGS